MDAVVKVGGSLAEEPNRLKDLCSKLAEFAKIYKLLVVPGGGLFADAARNVDRLFNLSSKLSHRMAILGMDQFGMLLSQIIPNSCATYLLADAQQLSEIGVVPILLVSRFLFREDPLKNSWDVTSDSIAVYVATRLQATRVLLLTDVDGIFTKDPKKHADATLIKKLSPEELMKFNTRTSVDRYLAELLLGTPVDCYVINGKYPERIKAILAGQNTTCTFIPARNG